jgi:hypothetical protein
VLQLHSSIFVFIHHAFHHCLLAGQPISWVKSANQCPEKLILHSLEGLLVRDDPLHKSIVDAVHFRLIVSAIRAKCEDIKCALPKLKISTVMF